MNKYYVYAWYVEEELVYIGKGKGDRWKHGNSGTSSCFGLNELFFSDKRDLLNHKILECNLTEKDAYRIETELILKHKPRLNSKVLNNSFPNKPVFKGTNTLKDFKDCLSEQNKHLSLDKKDKICKAFKQLINYHGLEEVSKDAFSFKSQHDYRKLGCVELANIVHYMEYNRCGSVSNVATVFLTALDLFRQRLVR